MVRGEMMAKETKKELTYNLTYKEVVDILQIMNESTNCQELHLELGDLKLAIVRQANHLPGKPAGHTKVEPGNALFPEASRIAEVEKTEPILPEPQERDPQEGGSSGVAVKSPLIGTFYRAPAPGAPPFVEVGSRVKENDIVGIIDVMKLMNTIKAGVQGVISKICVENEQMVEYGQALMIIDPVQK
jgi:acetyl-CoA carboxylase biotin carboxyl carrier protein